MSYTDKQLLQQIAAGDQAAFDTLYQGYSKPLYNYIVRLTQEPTAAQDLLQEVFIAIWQSAARFRGQSQVKTWLFSIAHNQAVSWLRRRKKTTQLDDVDKCIVQDSHEEQSIEKQRIDHILEAVNRLSSKHRAVIELAFAHNLSYAEISEIVGCPVGTVKSRMNYALRHLNGSLKRMDAKDLSE